MHDYIYPTMAHVCPISLHYISVTGPQTSMVFLGQFTPFIVTVQVLRYHILYHYGCQMHECVTLGVCRAYELLVPYMYIHVHINYCVLMTTYNVMTFSGYGIFYVLDTAYCLNPYKQRYYCFDDQEVKEVNHRQVKVICNFFSPPPLPSVYG